MRREALGIALILGSCAAPAVGAQSSVALPERADSACSYRSCALSIQPTWNGLVLILAFAPSAGLGALFISVPLQFAADGALSKAVWWHNVRYAP